MSLPGEKDCPALSSSLEEIDLTHTDKVGMETGLKMILVLVPNWSETLIY